MKIKTIKLNWGGTEERRRSQSQDLSEDDETSPQKKISWGRTALPISTIATKIVFMMLTCCCYAFPKFLMKWIFKSAIYIFVHCCAYSIFCQFTEEIQLNFQYKICFTWIFLMLRIKYRYLGTVFEEWKGYAKNKSNFSNFDENSTKIGILSPGLTNSKPGIESWRQNTGIPVITPTTTTLV
jgi:hypothetical protein